MNGSGIISRPRRLRVVVLIVFSLLLRSSSLAWAADNIIIGMAGMNFSFLPFQIATEKRFYEKYDLSVKPD